MSERNTGPVKPPVLDLSARESKPGGEQAGKPEAQQSAATSGKPDDKAKAQAKPQAVGREFHWAPALIGVAGGALLGTALTYGLLLSGALPQPAPAADPRIAQFEARLAAASQSAQAEVATLTQRVATLQNDLDARLEAANEAVTALRQEGGATAPDLTPLKAQLEAMGKRIDELGTAASSAGSQAAAGEVEGLRSGMAALTAQLESLQGRLESTDSKVSDLAAQAEKTPELPAVQLPLLISSLESAFAAGRPFATELAGLAAIAPGTPVPANLAARAETGLKRPDELASAIAAILPDMLAATPARPDASWTDTALDWLKSQMAFRPVGEVAGASPEAQVSQIESAIGRGDYARASALLSALPAPMQAPATDLAQEVALHAEADQLVAGLRASALKANEVGAQ